MRKLWTIMLAGCLVLATLPAAALAGDAHAARHVWTGVGIGVAVAALGGLLISAAPPPFVAPGPPVRSALPPAVYAPPPLVVYSPRSVVVYRGWRPPGHWKHHPHLAHGYH